MIFRKNDGTDICSRIRQSVCVISLKSRDMPLC